MKVKILIIIFYLLPSISVKSQNDSVFNAFRIPRNLIYSQLGGISLVTLGYAQNIKFKNQDYIQLKTGVSYGLSIFTGYNSELNLFAEKHKNNKKQKYFITGIGASAIYEIRSYGAYELKFKNYLLRRKMFSINFGYYCTINPHFSWEFKVYLNLFIIPPYYLPLSSYKDRFSGTIPFPMISYTINFGLGKK